MTAFRIEPRANRRLDEIYDYTADIWGEDQADLYIAGLFDEFARIARRDVPWRALPRSFGLDAYHYRWRRHVIYWKAGPDGDIRILSILHEKMDQMHRLRDDLEEF